MLPNAVLVVDDEPIVLDVLAVALKKKGLEVFTSTTLAEANTLAANHAFACVLVDKNLPDGSGLELIERFRSVQPLCACLVMTGYPNADAILQAMRLGAVDFLEKPFAAIAVIQEKVVSIVARQQLLAEREGLAARVKQLQERGGQEDFRETAQIALLQQALEVAQEDLQTARAAADASAQHEVELLTSRLDALKFRYARMVTAMRQSAAALSNLLEAHAVSPEADRELREARRALTQVLDESGRSLPRVD
jgi:FixJ family two-component response regulator